MKIGAAKKFRHPGIRTPLFDITTETDEHRITGFRLKTKSASYWYPVKNDNVVGAWQRLEKQAENIIKRSERR